MNWLSKLKCYWWIEFNRENLFALLEKVIVAENQSILLSTKGFDSPHICSFAPEDEVIKNGYLLCGSFNPLHIGHMSMLSCIGELKESESCFYVLSITNCDKGTIDHETIFQRAS